MPVDPAAGGRALARTLAAEGRALGLRAVPRIDWLYNPGNFQNASFRVTDGATHLHVKLVEDASRPDVWFRLRERLARDYRAPPILARLDLPADGLTAFVFPRLAGREADASRDRSLLPRFAALLRRLHADDSLAAALDEPPPRSRVSFRTAFESGLLECLTGDVAALAACPEVAPPEVGPWLDWLADERDALRLAGTKLLPDVPATAPIHGDPWLANFLVDGDDWHLLDWDEIRRGDPASDYAMLLLRPWALGEEPEAHVPPDADLRARVAFLLRAASFDAIVDPLSDLTEMPADVPGAADIHLQKRAASVEAFLRYRRVYG